MDPIREGPDALEGLKVWDMSWVGVGPLTGRYLANHGAEVIRLDSTQHPDVLRLAPPNKDGEEGINRSQFYADYNTGKKGIGLDLGKQKGREIALELVEWADVVLESFTPRVKENLDLTYEIIAQRNPETIMMSSCMQGQTGPHRNYSGFGQLMTCITGFTSLNGYDDDSYPLLPYGAYTDFICPRFITPMVIAALDYRDRTGKGQFIDASQMEIGLHFLTPYILDYEANGRVATRCGNKSPAAAPHENYPCRGEDNWCAVVVETDKDWLSLKKKMGHPDWAEDPKFDTLRGRKEHEKELDNRMAEWTRQFGPYELMYRLQPEVPAGVAQSASQLTQDDPQVNFRNYFQELEHSEMGTVSSNCGQPFEFSKTPGRCQSAAPKLGEHTEWVLKEILGKDQGKVDELFTKGVVETT